MHPGDDAGGTPPSISDYALLSNCRGAVLVSRDGSIDWACLPSFESPATFARILGPDAGHWSIRPAFDFDVVRAYVPGTMVLRTEFRLSGATVTLTDALVLRAEGEDSEIGADSPPTILRVLEAVEGSAVFHVELAPRPEYGLTRPFLIPVDGGLQSFGGSTAFTITWPVAADAVQSTAETRFTIAEGQKIAFALQEFTPWEIRPAPMPEEEIHAALDGTIGLWQAWSHNHETDYDGPYRDEVNRSALVLQALQYARTKAIVAAPTMALPEAIGGERNWDYRYAWVRDASMAVSALVEASHDFKALGFFNFFVTAAAGRVTEGHDLQILYGIHGQRYLPETVLDHLPGYRGSQPVRVGNGAYDQIQLDIFGHLLQAAWALWRADRDFNPTIARFLRDLADCAAARWHEKDYGIWEQRAGLQHTLFSKLMCWVALDRAVHMCDAIGATQHAVDRWSEARDAVRNAIETDGWSEKLGAYTQAFGVDALDASTLMMPLTGFVDAQDTRMRATIEAIEAELCDDNGFVFRYRDEDGLKGTEGTFAICTFWLVGCLALLGRHDDAHALFSRVLDCANDVGLLSEELGPDGAMLGNFPQALTHIGLLMAAFALEDRFTLMYPSDEDPAGSTDS
ncbi:MAG: glycoside hydrolase family 15 protein [Acidimicrobiia bacterium]|nr:glycoside hydrolase family 15 protein [Acidimicrobiia bacterium]